MEVKFSMRTKSCGVHGGSQVAYSWEEPVSNTPIFSAYNKRQGFSRCHQHEQFWEDKMVQHSRKQKTDSPTMWGWACAAKATTDTRIASLCSCSLSGHWVANADSQELREVAHSKAKGMETLSNMISRFLWCGKKNSLSCTYTTHRLPPSSHMSGTWDLFQIPPLMVL